MGMLILTRRINEEIVITTATGEKISILLMSIKGNQARMGVDAPRTMTVHRREVQDRIDREEKESVRNS